MRLVIVGGFLGSGKTTAIITACRELIRNGKRVAVITNDQGIRQVDGAFVRSQGIPTREVGNGCFCCRYDELDGHLASLLRDENPDLIFAESVGSCTDLVATLAKPLHKLRPEIDATISIFVDAALVLALLEGRTSFLDESLRYIFKKQMEEADTIIVNKADLLTKAELKKVSDAVRNENEGCLLLHQDSQDPPGIGRWLESILEGTTRNRSSLELDYLVYGDGESRLAWLDKAIRIRAPHGNARFALGLIVQLVFDRLQKEHKSVGHLKFLLESDQGIEKISLTASSPGGKVRMIPDELNDLRVLINARVKTTPDHLESLMADAIRRAERSCSCQITTEAQASFSPAFPKPTHRMG